MSKISYLRDFQSTPGAMPVEHHRLVSFLASKLQSEGEKSNLPPDLVPVGAQRWALTARHAELERFLIPCGAAIVEDEVAVLLKVMASAGDDVDGIMVTLRLYGEALADLPTFALRAACRDYRDGRFGEWLPKTAALRIRAEFYIGNLRRERSALVAILRADPAPVRKPSTAEERRAFVARVRSGLAAPVADAKAIDDASAREWRANDKLAREADVRLAAMNAKASSVRIGAELATKLKSASPSEPKSPSVEPSCQTRTISRRPKRKAKPT